MALINLRMVIGYYVKGAFINNYVTSDLRVGEGDDAVILLDPNYFIKKLTKGMEFLSKIGK